MNKVFYELNADTLEATFWAENNPENKQTIKGRFQTYSGARASKNNSRIIFSNLPNFCEPQKTITLNPNEPTGDFVPKLNTKTNTSNYTKKALFEYIKVGDIPEYLDNENDKQLLIDLLDKAKANFDKKQAEKRKMGFQNVLNGLEKMGLSRDELLSLLTTQIEQAKAENTTTENK
jgi:hypothetical protein